MMNRRHFIKAIGATAAAFSSGGGDPVSANTSKPNIVFFLIDDLGWRDLRFMGSQYYETPNIDRLAAQGMVFTDAYANAPNCAPSRACLMSGQYPPRHGIYTVGTSERGQSKNRQLIPTPNKTVLDPSIETLAESLQRGGYTTGFVGKWHLGSSEHTRPEGQGFDVNAGGNRAGHPRSYFSPYKNPNLADGPKGEYLTDRLTDEALGFIRRNQDQPFFLYFNHYAVHTPIQAPEALTAKYQRKTPDGDQKNPEYAAMIESVDRSVGRVMQILDEMKLAERTLVVFFSDNGGHGAITSNAPLRGSKGMLYEGGIREPLIVRWPGRTQPGVRCSVPVIGTDFYPTLLEATGTPPPANQTLDGESLIPLFHGERSLKRDAIFWHFPAYLEPYTSHQGLWRTTPTGAVRKGDWKLIEFFEDGRLELYNLKDDLSETNNLASTRKDKVLELHETMKQWRRDTQAPVPTTLNPNYRPTAPDA